MPNINPLSYLRIYIEGRGDIGVGDRVFLTKHGRGRYAILDMEEYEKMQATIRLMSALSKGEQSAKESGWMELDEVEKLLGVSHDAS